MAGGGVTTTWGAVKGHSMRKVGHHCPSLYPTDKHFLQFYLFYMNGCFACMYGCVPRECLVTSKVRRRHRIPLGVNIQIWVSGHAGSGNQAWVLCRSHGCS